MKTHGQTMTRCARKARQRAARRQRRVWGGVYWTRLAAPHSAGALAKATKPERAVVEAALPAPRVDHGMLAGAMALLTGLFRRGRRSACSSI